MKMGCGAFCDACFSTRHTYNCSMWPGFCVLYTYDHKPDEPTAPRGVDCCGVNAVKRYAEYTICFMCLLSCRVTVLNLLTISFEVNAMNDINVIAMNDIDVVWLMC